MTHKTAPLRQFLMKHFARLALKLDPASVDFKKYSRLGSKLFAEQYAKSERMAIEKQA